MAGKMKQQLGGEMEIDQLRVRDDLEEEEEDEMSWMARKLFLYNVTIGLYGLDWWERYLFSILYHLSLFLLIHFYHFSFSFFWSNSVQ
ncbi:Os07g0447501 [Oryza sativa Japonica Group]|uniref:Os07g0447501 protein n=1 Tax=Oryza sativa subsp. japonica TaxID=39947 RepID=A0A0N7KND3_ORYSJ|nr:Os07g0447501 [Oryza sativa Japonica Group]